MTALPWRLGFFQRFPQWDDRSCPHILDNNWRDPFKTTVLHPGMRDVPLETNLKFVVDVVNSHESLKALLRKAVEMLKNQDKNVDGMDDLIGEAAKLIGEADNHKDGFAGLLSSHMNRT